MIAQISKIFTKIFGSRNDRLVKRVASAQLPTDHGPFQVFAYESLIDH